MNPHEEVYKFPPKKLTRTQRVPFKSNIKTTGTKPKIYYTERERERERTWEPKKIILWRRSMLVVSSSSNLGSHGEVVEADKSSETTQLEDKVCLEALTRDKDFVLPLVVVRMGTWEWKRFFVPRLKLKLSGVYAEAAPYAALTSIFFFFSLLFLVANGWPFSLGLTIDMNSFVNYKLGFRYLD